MSSKKIELSGKKERGVNAIIIRFIKSELKKVTVANIITRMGYTTRQALYFHINEKNAATANKQILSKIIDAINEEKAEQKREDKKLLKALSKKIA